MSQTYYTILTKIGTELIANATALGVQLKLTHMAVGDGNGSIPKPIATQTKLINEVRRAAINTVSVDKNNPNQIIAEQVIPETEGGWFIHEVGLYDDKGHLIAVGNCPSTYKPKLAEGSGRTQVIRMIIVIDNVDSIALKIDPAVVLATREYVDNLISTKISEHKKSTDHPNATTKSKGFVQLNSATNSESEAEAATPKAVKSAYDLASGAVKKSGDGMTGQLQFSPTSYGIKFKHENGNETVFRPSGSSFIYASYDVESNRWANKLRYTNNNWFFENIDDVTINNKSVLKVGDYGIGSSTGAIANNFDAHLNGGFYQCRTTDFSDLQFASNSAATLLAYPSSSSTWKVEQLSVVNSKEPRIYYRCDTKEGKQKWHEAITTANIKDFAYQLKGDLVNKSLNELTGTEAGIYFQGRNIQATTENNYPINEAGTLQVLKNGADGAGCCQIYTAYRNARQFIRNYRGGSKSWEPWIEQLTTSNVSADIFGGLPATKNENIYNVNVKINFENRPEINQSPMIVLSDFDVLFNESGYQKLPNGIIIQWGSSATNSAGIIDVKFPISFPNKFLSAILTEANANAWIAGSAYSYGYSRKLSTNSTIRVISRCISNNGLAGSPGNFSFIAIGY
ncbi:MAG: phage tail protein [Gilliamella sp.]|uniref:phage tail-collar fiber domain-containing protein n=1 Tax=Gilliamella sp. TaxID=1891236 RepID=UPI0025D71B62|nr:phage tail protein [Gilliamella sp.]MCO6549576.1 phage tail protein [Gilliamella sp.]